MREPIGVIGCGAVGSQIEKLLAGGGYKVEKYDPPQGYSDQERINDNCLVSFLALPTPLEPNSGFLDTALISETLEWLNTPLVIIRSTINLGDITKWASQTDKEICYSPAWGPGETASHPFRDMREDKFVVVAGSPSSRGMALEIYKHCYPSTVKFLQMAGIEAEILKLWENSYLGMVVNFFQELSDVCEFHGADYYTVREAMGEDPRIGRWGSFPMGGWQSKCLAKDIPVAVSSAMGNAPLLEAVLKINERQGYGQQS